MNGRNFLDLALLVPGVSPTNIGSTQLFAETSAVPGVRASRSAASATSRTTSSSTACRPTTMRPGLSGIPYGVDAIEQFQVVTSGGQAELGRALGGYVNVVTKSGTNALRGNVYGYFRDDRFNAPNALSGTKLPMDQQQFGASLGGPIAREPDVLLRQRRAAQARSDRPRRRSRRPNVGAINARLAQVGYPGPPVATGIYPNPVHTTNVLGKVDHQFSGRDQFSVRYSLLRRRRRATRAAPAALNAPSALGRPRQHRSDDRGQQHADAVAAHGQRDARAVRARRSEGARRPIRSARRSASPASRRSARSRAARRGALNTMYQVVNNLSHQAGAHALRAGVDFLYNDDTITFRASFRGSYTLLVAGELPDRHLQQRRLHPDVRRPGRRADQPERRHLRAGRVEGQLAR